MDKRVKRTLLLLTAAVTLFGLSEMYVTPFMFWVRAASAGMALAGVVAVILIFVDEFKARK